MAELRADCSRCFALCCVALAFTRSADFPIDKPPGTPCLNLAESAHTCTVHESLTERGFNGCVSYDCFGAGQRVSQQTFGGRDWRTHPEIAADMFAALPVMRQLHELLTYLADAAARPAAKPLASVLHDLTARTESLAAGDVLSAPVEELRGQVAPALREASRLSRAGLPGADHAGADLLGANLAGADLAGADLRGAYVIGADLRRADLRTADLLGADLRGACLEDADLTDALFLTQTQLNSARGNQATRFSPRLTRPAHWR